MTVPASNAVVIFIMASHVCRAITMAGCRMHSTAIPRNKIAASASIGGEAVVSDIELAWLRECQQTGRFPLRKWHRYGSNDHFDRGLKPASLLQHEIRGVCELRITARRCAPLRGSLRGCFEGTAQKETVRPDDRGAAPARAVEGHQSHGRAASKCRDGSAGGERRNRASRGQSSSAKEGRPVECYKCMNF